MQLKKYWKKYMTDKSFGIIALILTSLIIWYLLGVNEHNISANNNEDCEMAGGDWHSRH